MKSRQELFLSQFDSNFKTHIIEFSKRLTKISEEYDVIIFLARKAACLADCLQELGLCSFHCTITSSRILDMNLNWLKSKRIAIVDDALISGTTIHEALNKLKGNGFSKVDVYVLSVDKDWWSKSLVNPIQPYFKLESNQTSQICSNIVNAISVVPRPYTIDYPLYKNIRIKKTNFQDLSSSSDWIVYESTSSHQAKNNIQNLTIVPSEPALLTFLDSIGLDFCNNSLVKIRLYALSVGEIYLCQILPIVILPPISVKDLDKIFIKICDLFSEKNICDWFETSTQDDCIKAKLRLVQYYLASKLFQYWSNDTLIKLDKNIIIEQDSRNINFLFPPPISNSIKNIFSKSIYFRDISVQFLKETYIEHSRSNTEDFDESVALYKLSKPFLDLFINKEIKARKLVKEYGRNIFENVEYKHLINRLNQGYSINDLKNFVKNISQNVNVNKLVSYFLDLYIDRGAVVPITFIKDGLVYRAFRHGEDVEFSENEIRLCISMLEKFVKEYGSDNIPHTVVEKLLVLFIRVGINKDFLTISTNPLSDFSSMGIRFYLHGAIVGSFDKSIYKVNFNNSLTHVLEESGYLTRKTFDDPYTIGKAPKSGIDSRGLNIANQLGIVMGNLLKTNNPKISIDELILLATCPSIIDTIGAMAAEIYIFEGFFQYQQHLYFKEYKLNSLTHFSKIRNEKTVKGFTALNSGTWKFENFKTGTPWAVIEKASNYLENDLYKEVWKSFWPSTGKETSTETVNLQLNKLIDNLADWLYNTRFFINIIELTLSANFDRFLKSKANKEIKNIIEETYKYQPKLSGTFKSMYDEHCVKYKNENLNKELLYDLSRDKLNIQYQQGRQLLAEVDALANNFGEIEKTIFYEHVIVIDFKVFNIEKKELMKRYKNILDQIKLEAKKNNEAFLFDIPNQYSVIKTGNWICARGEKSIHWLLKLSNQLEYELNDYTTLKFTYFFYLDTFRILKKLSSNQCYAPLFWDIAKDLLRTKFKEQIGHEAIYFTSSDVNKIPIENEIQNELKGFEPHPRGEKDITIESPYTLNFKSNHFVKHRGKQITKTMDIGIITIVTEELVGVTDYFAENSTLFEKRGTQSSRNYYFGKMIDKSGKELNVVTVKASDQGTASVIPAYNALSEEFNPTLIILLGIAGSIHKDVNICDVVICDSIYYYDKRAVTKEGTKRRINPFKINAWTRELVSRYHFRNKSESPSFPAAEFSPKLFFNSFFGPIGTGEAVIKYEDSDERKWLLSVNDKTLGIETEAGGVAQQFYEDELSYSRRAKGILVIRGISDKADVKKNDKWRLAASKNAMKVLEEIVKSNTLD